MRVSEKAGEVTGVAMESPTVRRVARSVLTGLWETQTPTKRMKMPLGEDLDGDGGSKGDKGDKDEDL